MIVANAPELVAASDAARMHRMALDYLYRLQEWVMSHSFDAEVDSDAMCVFVDIPAVDRAGNWTVIRERVATLTEARNALGY